MLANRIYKLLLILLAVGAIVFAFTPNIGAKMKITCDYCKEEIKGHYLEANGKHYHVAHYLCDECGELLANEKVYLKGGKKYCEKCYNKLFAPKCAYCGRIIEDRSVLYKGMSYHRDCFENHVALKCTLCGEIITGEYLQDFWGNAYHSSHKGEFPQCESCGRFISEEITGGGSRYPDGRHICNLCKSKALTDLDRAGEVFDKVKLQLAGENIRIEDDDIKLHLVDKNQLKEMSGEDSDSQKGYTRYKYTKIGNHQAAKHFDIYVLDAMPEMNFISIAAHELMHVWQHENSPAKNDPAFCEGSCNYASFLVLKHYSGEIAEYLIDNLNRDDDKIYGDGFRRVKKLAEDHGLDYWLRHLKSHKNFPAGY
ncbi:MAG: protein DA1 [Candidatus Zixiibacteriota bacterium]|nr:MAG: protein DA1 [candidate division Zixibacteria bacterium]